MQCCKNLKHRVNDRKNIPKGKTSRLFGKLKVLIVLHGIS